MPRSTADASLSIGALRERWMPLASHQVTVSARTPLAFNSAARAARSVVLTGAPSDGCSTVRSREGTRVARRSGDAQDDLAEALRIGQPAGRGGDVAERVHRVDRGSPGARRHVLAERAELARAAHGRADHRAPVPVEVEDGDGRRLAAGVAVVDDRAAARERAQRLRPAARRRTSRSRRGRPRRRSRRAPAPATPGRRSGSRPAAPSSTQRAILASLPEVTQTLRAERVRDLQAARRDAGSAARDEQAPPGRRARARHGRAPGREPGEREGRRLLPAQPGRPGMDVDRRHDDALRERARRSASRGCRTPRRPRARRRPSRARGRSRPRLPARCPRRRRRPPPRGPRRRSRASRERGVEASRQIHQSRRLSAAVTSSTDDLAGGRDRVGKLLDLEAGLARGEREEGCAHGAHPDGPSAAGAPV